MHGEDLVVEKYFKNITNGFYVDLGCFHPILYNNTMLLYQKGWRGINIDISKFSIKLSPKFVFSNISVFLINYDELWWIFFKLLNVQSRGSFTQESEPRVQGVTERELKLNVALTALF